ncbi:MAG: HAMP domain-containing protein [Archangiaceae bacterium]|nr:HAMP domain-containing protein [Archangiaceae bacterium]
MRLSLATRIFLGYAAVLIAFGAVSLFAVTEMRKTQEEMRLVAQGYLHLSQIASDIEGYFTSQQREITRLPEEKNPEARRLSISLARQYFEKTMSSKLSDAQQRAREAAQLVSSESEAAFVREVSARLRGLEGSMDRYIEAREEAFKVLEITTPDPELAKDKVDRVIILQNQLTSAVRLLHASLETRILDRVAQAQARERLTGALIIALSVLAILVGLLATAVAARALRPVQTLIQGVSRVGRGDYSAQLGFEGQDEIAQLSREFDQMAKSLKEREAQLLQAERLAAMGRVAAQISHEVRNPLSSIGLNAEMIDELLQTAKFRTEAEAKEARELLAKVSREVDRLTEITEEYLRLARLPAPALKREDLNQVLRGVVDFSREELERSNVKVAEALSVDPVFAQADEGQLKQVLLNLVRNGREAMAEMGGGQLTLATRAQNGHVEIEVADTGPGLTAEATRRLFEPFFSTKPGGTGLGLSLSRQIVQAHGGRLEVEAAPHAGARFLITLPSAPKES